MICLKVQNVLLLIVNRWFFVFASTMLVVGYNFRDFDIFDKYYFLCVGEIGRGCILCVLFSGINGHKRVYLYPEKVYLYHPKV